MRNRSTLTLLTGLAGVALCAALTGCTSTVPAGSGSPSKPATNTSTDPAAAFLSCLKQEEVEAKLNGNGQVMVKLPSTEDQNGGQIGIGTGSGGSEAILGIEGDDAGNQWLIAAAPEAFEDPAIRASYATCQSQHPGFTQPDYDPQSDPAVVEQQRKDEAAALAFAQCARAAGFSNWSDPTPEMGGAVVLPAGITQDEFREVAKACWDPDSTVPLGMPSDLGWDPWDILDELFGLSGR